MRLKLKVSRVASKGQLCSFTVLKGISMSKLIVVALTLVASFSHAADFKAAYVDIQRAVQEVQEGKQAKAKLQIMADKKSKDFEKEQLALKAEVEAFQKQAPTMEDKVRSAKEQELQKKAYEFGQKAEKLRVEVADSERKELGKIFPRMETLLGQIAARESLTMVFDKSSSGLAWAPPSLDLTNELIRMYDAQFKPGAVVPAVEPKKEEPKKDAPKKDAPR
jgi:outer membrane protein